MKRLPGFRFNAKASLLCHGHAHCQILREEI
jgi:hypothetical protein